MKKHIVIVGATSAIAEQCARLWIHQKDVVLTLIGRDTEKLAAIANDLSVRSTSNYVSTLVTDFFNPEIIQKTVDTIADIGEIDIVLIAHGALSDQHQCQRDLSKLNEAMHVNALSPVLFAEAFAQKLEQQKHGKLAIIGSVAGDRGRQSNYVYGAAKGLIARYVEGMQHRFATSGISISVIKPGPTDTPMTTTLKQRGVKLATAETVAECIVKGIETDKPVIYAPARWALIMLIIRHLPRVVFNRLRI